MRGQRRQSARDVPTAERLSVPASGGRTWWAHFEFTRISIELTILLKEIEDLREARTTLLNATAYIVADLHPR